MLVLIVDDQYEGKTKLITRILANIAGVECCHVASARDALKVLKVRHVELLVLDLQIPAELGQDVDQEGGKALLEFVELSQDVIKPSRVLALTAHADSYLQCGDFFKVRGWALLLSPSEEELETLLRAQLMGGVGETPKFDIAVVTALEHTELEAVLKLPYGWRQVRYRNDISSYYCGEVPLDDGTRKSIIACSAPRMGMAATAALATKICLKFEPQVLAMTGVAAAIKGEAELGDVLVADPSWDWGSGKMTVKDGKPIFLSDPAQIPLDPELSAKIRTLAISRQYLDEIYSAYKGGARPPHDLTVRVGPVASGAVVLEDPLTVELIKSQNRKTIGIEMEAYGAMSAAFYTGANRPLTLVLKSVCDFADPHKNNQWQAYAAYTSSSYLDKLLRSHIFA
jgi:nucleoside phosphorylase